MAAGEWGRLSGLVGALCLALSTAWAMDPVDMTGHAKTSSGIIILKPGELPGYEDLRYPEGVGSTLAAEYLRSLTVVAEDRGTSAIIFPEVPETARHSRITLPRLVDLALAQNFTLENSERSVRIARSNTTTAEAPFIPFVDLIANSRVREDRDINAERAAAPDPNDPLAEPDPTTTTRNTRTFRNEVGAEGGVDLKSGGSITASGVTGRNDTIIKDGSGQLSDTKDYDSRVDVRFLQPLLRGGGFDAGTAELRRARISEMDQVMADQIQTRDVTFNVISNYFRILQSARQLLVSRDAIQERLKFMEETQVRYDVGRVDESEILRAEINYLNELETAISRRRQLDEQRENMLILLGLPLDTPISFIDITPELVELGRVDIPAAEDSVQEALNSRLELMRSDLSLALSEIDRRLARNDLLPQLDFDAGFGRTDAGEEFTEAAGLEDNSWDAGLGLRIPIPNIQRRESHRRAVIRLEQQRTNRLSTERDLTQEVLASRRNILATEATLTILSKSVEQARKSLELINGRFEVGFATVTEVRLAQDDLFQSQTRINNAFLDYQISLARLYVALGRPLL